MRKGELVSRGGYPAETRLGVSGTGKQRIRVYERDGGQEGPLFRQLSAIHHPLILTALFS